MKAVSRKILSFYPVGKEVPSGFSNSFHWYVINVRSRHEFKVLDRLSKIGVDTFLPIVEKMNKWKDRKKLVNFPLFPGYLFLYMVTDRQNVLDVLKTSGVVNFLNKKPGEPESVPEEQINSLKKLVESRESVDPYPYLKEGQKVRVKRGPLAGVEGFLSKRIGQHILILLVDMIRQGVSLKIDAIDVEQI